MHSKGPKINKIEVPPRWIIIFSTLLISLVLWGAVILIGQEMFRRLDIEIAQGLEDFR